MMDREQIIEIVKLTVKELKREELLRDAEGVAYKEISERLRMLYEEGHSDPELRYALKEIQGDRYFDTVFLYYAKGFTVEAIAELLDVDVRTVTRNKKRLCLDLYFRLQD